MRTAARALSFLRLTDEDGNLSLTHLALIFAATCIWVGKPISLPDFGAFALALGAYAAKRHLSNGKAEPDPRVAALEEQLKTISGHMATILNQPALQRFGLTPRKP